MARMTGIVQKDKKLAMWLKYNEAHILPRWVREVRAQGREEDRILSTQQLSQHHLLSFYDSVVEAARTGGFAPLHSLLNEMVFNRVQQAYNIDEILLVPQQLRLAIHEYATATEPPDRALTIIAAVEPLLAQSISFIVRSFTDLTEGMLNERLADAELMAQSLHRANEEANRSLMQLRTLYNVSRDCGRTVEIEQTLGLIAEHLAAAANIDRCAMWMAGKSGTLVVAVARGIAAQQLEGLTLSPSKRSFVSEALRRLEHQLLEDRFNGRPLKDPLGDAFTMRSALAMPLVSEGQAIGIITVDRRSTTHPFDVSTIDMVRSVAEQAAIAIKTARLYDQLTHFNQQLEQRVQQRTKELQRAMQDLEELDRTKSDFISIAAHELKTPLTLIQGYTNILKDSVDQQKPRHVVMVQGITTGVERLMAIIEDMIDVSIIDTEALTLHLTSALPARVVQSALSMFDEVMDERTLTIAINGLDELPDIECDAQRLHQAFVNVIGNAIKYTPDGGRIDITGHLLPTNETGSGEFIEVTVTDTGIGIDPKHHHRIFDKFYQVGDLVHHSSGKTKFKGGGPGLGLAITKGIIEAHGGQIWVESAGYDEEHFPGSTFHILLPVQATRILKDVHAKRATERKNKAVSTRMTSTN
jgi:signal transduction histidine kinase